MQAAPDGCLDLWAREHYKSTIITFGLVLQDILASHGEDPLPRWGGREATVGIFSHTRPVAKGFMRQLMRELEGNALLRAWFPDVLWAEPRKEAPKWSEDDGIILRRRSNPKEATVEAWGLVDGQPIGKHFVLRIYDDVVTPESVNTPEMIEKTTRAWELSQALGTEGGVARYIGTRYHFNDTYREMMARGIPARTHPATVDGTVDGEPVFMSKATLAEKRRIMGPYTFACQMLLNPVADETQGFRAEWLRHYRSHDGDGLNKYVLVDPASSKKKGSDYTAAWVLGAGPDENLYVLDVVRDRLSLTQRAELLFRLHRRWKPLGVGYEEYGLQADIEHIGERMERENYRFTITPLGGRTKKEDRIRRLIPWFEQGRIWLPETLHRTDYQGVTRDLVQVFIEEEYKAFPVSVHDDMLDALARILDEKMNLTFPKTHEGGGWDDLARDAAGWMGG